MKSFVTHIPTKLVFGAGELQRLGAFAAEYGKKAMVVTTGNDMARLGNLAKALQALNSAGVDSIVYSDIEPNPKDYNIDQGVSIFNAEGCDMVVGLGGGSAMDGAKAISMVAKNGGTVMDYMPGHFRYAEELREVYPILCVTTTAGTGSEATFFSVITNSITHEKPGLGWPCMMPVVSIIDPELMLSLPAGITAQTGVDVFFHAMEAYLSTVATPYTDMVALEAMRTVVEYLPKVLSAPADLEARGKMAWANTLGGIAIVLAATCGLHAMGHSISGITDVPHGRALASVAVAFLDYTWDADPVRYANVARILGADPTSSDKGVAANSGRLMEAFLRSAGMQCSLSEISVRKEQVASIADVTCSSMAYCMGVTLKKLDRSDIIAILNRAL